MSNMVGDYSEDEYRSWSRHIRLHDVIAQKTTILIFMAMTI